jgi:hypothetical protein
MANTCHLGRCWAFEHGRKIVFDEGKNLSCHLHSMTLETCRKEPPTSPDVVGSPDQEKVEIRMILSESWRPCVQASLLAASCKKITRSVLLCGSTTAGSTWNAPVEYLLPLSFCRMERNIIKCSSLVFAKTQGTGRGCRSIGLGFDQHPEAWSVCPVSEKTQRPTSTKSDDQGPASSTLDD